MMCKRFTRESMNIRGAWVRGVGGSCGAVLMAGAVCATCYFVPEVPLSQKQAEALPQQSAFEDMATSYSRRYTVVMVSVGRKLQQRNVQNRLRGRGWCSSVTSSVSSPYLRSVHLWLCRLVPTVVCACRDRLFWEVCLRWRFGRAQTQRRP